MTARPEAIMSKGSRMPPAAVNPTNASLPTTVKTKALQTTHDPSSRFIENGAQPGITPTHSLSLGDATGFRC